MTASRRSLGSLPCSQQQTRSSWSLLCNAGPPSFQSSGGIPSTPAALPLLNFSTALVISSQRKSNSALNGYLGMWRTDGSWTTQSVLKRDWKWSDQWLRMEALSVKSTAQRTQDPVSCKIGPPLILNFAKLPLEDAANETEVSPPHRTWRLSRVGLVGRSLLSQQFLNLLVVFGEPVFVLGGKHQNLFRYLQDGTLQLIPECFRRSVFWTFAVFKLGL